MLLTEKMTSTLIKRTEEEIETMKLLKGVFARQEATKEDIEKVRRAADQSGQVGVEDFAKAMAQQIAVNPGLFVGLRVLLTVRLGTLMNLGEERSEIHQLLSCLHADNALMENRRAARVGPARGRAVKIYTERRRKEIIAGDMD